MIDVEIVILVYGCDTIPKYKNQIDKMNEVYSDVLKNYPNIKLLYFLGEEKTDLIGEQYIHLNGVKNDYLSASYKQFLGLKYIYEKYSAKFVMCIGTDTYVNIKKLVLFLKKFDPSDNLYIGGHGCKRKLEGVDVYFHSGGAGFIITNNCLKKIYPKLENFMDEWTQICIDNNREDLIPACDVGFAYLVNLKEIATQTINCGLEFTGCNYKGYPCHVNKVDCSKLISCHNMSLTDFDKFTQILRENNYFIGNVTK